MRDPHILLRPATTADQQPIIHLIDGVYREYGDRVHLDDADADLLGIPNHYEETGGAFVVLERHDQIVGTHAFVPLEPASGVCTFRRLYLHTSLRGGDWGQRLMDWAFDWGREHGYRRVEFWSDTRFARAHAFFRRLGFEHDGRVREMDDGWQPYQEYFFWREL